MNNQKNYPVQKIQKSCEQGLKQLLELQAMKWEKIGDKPCQMFKLQRNGRVACKGTTIVPISCSEVRKFLSQDDSLTKLNPMLKQNKVLGTFDNGNYTVRYLRYKGIWPVSDRDFVLCQGQANINKKIYQYTQDCTFPYPEVNGVVRGSCIAGAFIIEELDEKNTRVTYISQADLNGNIPNMIKNKVSEGEGQIVSRIYQAIKKK